VALAALGDGDQLDQPGRLDEQLDELHAHQQRVLVGQVEALVVLRGELGVGDDVPHDGGGVPGRGGLLSCSSDDPVQAGVLLAEQGGS
jgi:hypothetical protein